MFNQIRGIFSNDISIDLGTANTLIYVCGKGILLNQPSIVAVSRRDGAINAKSVCAVGEAAKGMLGRTPEHIKTIRPLRDGVIADLLITEKMLQHFIRMVHRNTFVFLKPSPRVLICVPSGSTQVERRAIRESAKRAGARTVYLIEEPIAAAIGAGLPVNQPRGSMVLDIGGGTTEVAVISINGIVYSASVRIGGDHMDEAIMAYVQRKYASFIGDMTAEYIKHEIGCAYPLDETKVLEVRGRSLEGIPKDLNLSSDEILEALELPLTGILDAVKKALSETPPELIADIAEYGLVLTGGGALLKNLDRLLIKETKLPVFVADDPLTCVARGGGIYLETIHKYDQHTLIQT